MSYDEHEEVVADRFCHHCGAAQSDVDVRPIPGYPGYFASSEGRILGPNGWVKGSLNRSRGGYLQANLKDHLERRKTKKFHWLVALTFYGPKPQGQLIRHLNGNSQDNRPENLRYGTPAENERDKVAHRTDPRGERNPRARLTEAEVRQIRALLGAGETQQKIAEKYGVGRTAIRNIRSGKSWRHVK